MGSHMLLVILWSLAFLAGVGFFVWQMKGRLQLLFKMRTDDGRNYSPATFGTRLKNTLLYAFGQYKFFLGDQPAGWMHIIIFWGFVTLGIQVVTMFARGWFPDFHLPGFGTGVLARPYAFLKDFFEVAVAVVVLVGLVRWIVVKPTRLMGFLPAEARLRSQSHWEAVVILLFIFLIMTSGLLYDASRFVLLAGTPEIEWERPWSFAAARIAAAIPSGDAAGALGTAAWWVHNGVILVFLNLLPRSKHFHIITAIPNVFFGRVEPKGRLPRKNFEAEGALFGRSQLFHFTQKQVLDMYSCTECGRCSSVCPATDSGKVLAPRQFLINLRDALYANQDSLLKMAANAETDVVVGEGKAVIDEVIWSCNACRACEEACPVNIEYVDKIVDIRQHLVQEAARFPSELNRAFKGLETQSNPWGISSEERIGWATGLKVPTLETNPTPEYLYFVGCGNAFDANNKTNAQSFVRILNEAQVNYAVLGNTELCNGETARRLGNEYLFQTMAEALVATLNGAGVKKVLVNCPHCFNTFTNEYPEFGGRWEVIRAGDFTRQLVASGKVKIKGDFRKNVVYHDSCYYGRFNDVYDEPRDLLQKTGAKLSEMEMSGRTAKCCGAGGGRMWMEEPKDQRVNIQRADQALAKKPDVIATSCPFCKIMLSSAINEKGKQDEVKVMDVMEIVASQIWVPGT